MSYDVSDFFLFVNESIHGHIRSRPIFRITILACYVLRDPHTLFYSPSTVELIVRSLPDAYAERTLQFIAKYLNASHHVEFYLNWACSILTFHGPKENILSHQSLLTLHQSLSRKYELLSKVCDFNKYTMQVLSNMSNEVPERAADGDDSDDDNLVLIRSNDNGGDSDDEEMAEGSSGSSEDED